MGELRSRIATLLTTSSNCIQIYYIEKLVIIKIILKNKNINIYHLKLNLSNDLKLLNNLNIDGMVPINIRTVSTYPLTPLKDVSS